MHKVGEEFGASNFMVREAEQPVKAIANLFIANLHPGKRIANYSPTLELVRKFFTMMVLIEPYLIRKTASL